MAYHLFLFGAGERQARGSNSAANVLSMRPTIYFHLKFMFGRPKSASI
jgi:hypothetical protein